MEEFWYEWDRVKRKVFVLVDCTHSFNNHWVSKTKKKCKGGTEKAGKKW